MLRQPEAAFQKAEDWLDLRTGGHLFLLGLVCGLVIATGQAPFNLIVPSLFGLSAAYFVWRASKSAKRAFVFGLGQGFGYFALTLNWIVEPLLVDAARHAWMVPFALPLMSGGLALFWAFAAWAAFRLGSVAGYKGIAWATLLTLAEFARSHVLTGFPWGLISYIWSETSAIHLAAIAGPHGLTFITCLSVVLALHLLTVMPRTFLKLLAILSLIAIPAVGWLLKPDIAPIGPERPIVRLIQPNAGQTEKWDPQMMPVFFNRQVAFTAADADRQPDLIIWPESAIPVLLDQGQAVLDVIGRAAEEVPVVIGAQRSEGFRYYNSLAVLRQGVVQDIYDKHHLVPFGEYFPLAGLAARFGFLGLAVQEEAGFSAGPGPRLISVGALGKALPLICYEAVFPHLVGGVSERPDILLQITNDGWFGEFSGPQQHLAQARFRAVEQGLPMVRVANTGISAVIGPDGRVLSFLPLDKAGYLDAPVPKALTPTIYSHTGDWPVLMLLLLGLVRTQIRARSKFI